MNEKISVLMTSYNYENYIGEAIQSVINQTYTNWELIIIDDASADNSVDVIRNFEKNDPRIRLYVNENNFGLAENIKKGIQLSTGNWIAFLESDDIYTPDSLEEKVNAISNDTDLIFSDYEAIPDSHCTDAYLENRQRFVDLSESKFIENFRNIINKINIIPTFSVVMVRKNLLEKCKYNTPVNALTDLFLWAQLSYSNVYYLNKKLTKWRRHDKSYIVNYKRNRWSEFSFAVAIYSYTIKKENFLKKFFLMLNYLRKYIITLNYNKENVRIRILREKLYTIKLPDFFKCIR